MIDQREDFERAFQKFEMPEPAFERLTRRREKKQRNQRVAAGAVAIGVFVAAVVFVTTGGQFDRSGSAPLPGGAGAGPSVTGPPEPIVSPQAGDITGLPLVGAMPSTPEHGRLVLSLEGGVAGPWTLVWVYADGRVIWGDAGGIFPAGAPTEGVTGFVEQHLTPEGVELLQNQVLATGLFEHDLELLIEPLSGFLTIEARNGDRLVKVTWAWDGIVGDDPPAPTPEQSNALEGIHALLAHPESWPASVWEDEDPTTYVPSRYQVWLRVFPDQGGGPPSPVGAREVELLPAPAADILRSGRNVREATYEMTTDDVRALALALDAAGVERWASPEDEAVLRYRLEDPYEPGSSLWVFVGPVLPHGEAYFLGPG